MSKTDFLSPNRTVLKLCLLAAFGQLIFGARAQDALKYSLADETPVETNAIDLQSADYTFKKGDFQLLVTPSLEADWNDNVTLVRDDAISDYIIRPMVQLDGSSPISEQNLFQFKIGAGYDFYTEHSQYSALRLESGSELSFDTFVKDFRFNFHDRFSYIEDPAEEATIAGTGRFGGLDNLAGISAFWDLKHAILSLDYDHRNFLSSSSGFEYLNLNSELILARASFLLGPVLTAGLESGASFTGYQQAVLNDNDSYSIGPFANWKPSTNLDLDGHVGYTSYYFFQTSHTVEAFDQYSVYGELTATHHITDQITYSVSAGHELRLGTEADAIKDWYLRVNGEWIVVHDLKFSPYVSLKSGKQGQANPQGTFVENFNWIATGFRLTEPVYKGLSVGLAYRLTLRGSSIPDRAYTQDFVGATVAYKID
jgi:hypothetical protein